MFKAAAIGIAIAIVAFLGARAEVPPAILSQPSAFPTLAPVLKKITPGVVSIASVRRINQGRRGILEVRNAGSGVVFDAAQGLIVTNNHVVEHADDIAVRLADGRSLNARLVGFDQDFDLAVIKAQADDLTPITFADSSKVQVGDFVLAIGYPGQFGQSVTSGIVSGLHRSNVGTGQYENFIQTDAAIYPGNSGGALIDIQGDLIGINTLYIGATSINPGMGFAISSNATQAIVEQIVRFGDINRGSLGITADDPSPSVAKALSLLNGGAVIKTVASGSAAERAGLKPGDIVTEIGTRTVLGSAFLRHRLALLRVGEIAELAVLRDGMPLTVRATIAPIESRARSR